MNSSEAKDAFEAIAIIGMSGRFPGAGNVDEFWQNLKNEVESIRFFTDEELMAAGVEVDLLRNKNYVKARGVINDVEVFDANFFGLNPREAEIIDPQHRVFLEEAYQALEDAGYDSQRYSGMIGVYAGAGANTYLLHNLLRNPNALASVANLLASTGNREDHLSTRVSYKLNLRGPSLGIQTACSTSLVAVHLACQGLLNYQCDMALAGGVSIGLPQESGYLYQEGGINSPDGHCRPFAADAQGTVGSSGAGVVVLKRLSDALAERDTILAVIRGSAINNDGALKVGYTAPSIEGQTQVIVMAQALSGLSPETITYIEAHGTATPLGDPIEVAALKEAFKGKMKRRQYCALGSVKSNIGHLDAAAGVAGLIKTVLALKHKQIPASLNYREPNGQMSLEDSPFYVNDRLRPWETQGHPRRAGVSSFGVGGTNAHVVLEEWREEPTRPLSDRRQMLVVSAKSAAALERMTKRLGAYLIESAEELEDMAFTSQVGRQRHPFRRVILCADKQDAITAIDEQRAEAIISGHEERQNAQIVFMFAGQGAQQVGMGEELYRREAIFREELDQCADMLRELTGRDIQAVIYPAAGNLQQARNEMVQTRTTQPVLFAVQYAMARMWMRMGVKPAAMIGHSLGEYVCACLAEVMSLQEALTLVVSRARLMQKVRRGAMLSVGLSEEQARKRLKPGLWLSSVNEAAHSVVGGEIEAIDELEKECRRDGVWSKRLETSHAFHSGMVDEIAGEFRVEVERVRLRKPQIPYISNLSGEWIRETEATAPGYWVEQMRQTVKFESGLDRVLAIEGAVLLEVGPGEHITAIVRRRASVGDRPYVIATIERKSSEKGDLVQRALAKMWLAGVQVDWNSYYGGRCKRVRMPPYSFDRQKYWIDAQDMVNGLKRQGINKWLYTPIWKQSIAEVAGQIKLRADGEAWMIITDELGIGSEIASQVQAEGIEVVRAGGDWHGMAEERRRYQRELKAIKDRGQWLGRIIHLRGIAPDGGIPQAEELFYGLLSLAQALGDEDIRKDNNRGADRQLEILIVTSDMQRVTGQESPSLEKSIVLGPCRVIPQEYPYVTCRSIDIALAEAVVSRSDLVDHILDEAASGSKEQVVSYRGGNRWVQAYEATNLPAPDAAKSRLRDGGVYLITGGLGGVGLELAHHLGSTVRAKLALLGRSVFPARSEWERRLESDADPQTNRRIRKLLEIERAGAEVLILTADVSREAEMQAAVRKINERFGVINGVIHAAGIPASGLTQLMTREQAAAVLAPKLQGTLVLDRLFRDAKIDLFVLCSSISAIVGRYGRLDYCAANAFLDSFAQHRSARHSSPVISINWDGWRGVGMGADSLDGHAPRTDDDSMSAKEGADVFARALGSDLAQLIVSLNDFNRRFARSILEPAWKSLQELESEKKSGARYVRPDLAIAYVPPRNGLEVALAGIWGELLGIDRVGVHDNFFELGGDSVVAIQVAARANEAGITLTVRQIFDHNSISELAAVGVQRSSFQAEQEVASGPVPLTPIQCSFLQAAPVDPHHFNQSAMLETDPTFEPFALDGVISAVLARHDAFRLRCGHKDDQWQQLVVDAEGDSGVQRVDLTGLSATWQRAEMERAASAVQTSLNIQVGPLIRAVLFHLGQPDQKRLLIVIHHFAVDAISWHILLEDMRSAYETLLKGNAIRPRHKSTSFKQWAERLKQYAGAPTVRAELKYWTEQSATHCKPLPVDQREGDNTVGSEDCVTSVLDEEYLQALREVASVYRMNAQEFLVAALASVLAKWTGETKVLIDFEGHGREPLFDDLDIARTVGWFTTIYPVALRVEEVENPAAVLGSIKQQLREIPNHGIGYGLLRYLHEDEDVRRQLRQLGRPGVSFLYLGQVDQLQPGRSAFKPAAESPGPNRSARQARGHMLEIDAMIRGGVLQVAWRYSRNLHRRSTIEALAARYIAALESLIRYATSPAEAALYLPSDFPQANVSQQELDEIIARFGHQGRSDQ
jgi:non-ribosomal peptide synthase protein (TIGR01720 family)